MFLFSKKNNSISKKSWKFWLVFWTISFFLLAVWYLFLKVRKDGWFGLLSLSHPIVSILPIENREKNEIKTVFDIVATLAEDKKEKTFLVLFQNDLELRPGGGFIGSFGIVKTQGEKVTFVDVHDTGVFDSRSASGIAPPYPMTKFLSIKDWELRDSNWSGDFPTNAQKAIELYRIQGGTENFDGVVAISTELLKTFLKATGPIEIEGYPGTYDSENAVTKLEYQVEKGYREQDIEKGKRKYIMKDMARELIDRAMKLDLSKKRALMEAIENHLRNKDIMIYFADEILQDKVKQIGWAGEVKDSPSDYLMFLDANLGSLKSDLFIKRAYEYTVDFRGEKPIATATIIYNHTALTKDWMTSNYNGYLRVLCPKNSWLFASENTGEQSFGDELDKKVFGSLIFVKIGEIKKISFSYYLPENINQETYQLLLQKQSGVGDAPVKLKFISKDGSAKNYDLTLTGDLKVENIF